MRAIEAQLTEHVGGAPSVMQRLLIRRLARVALRLELFDEKMNVGTLTDHDVRIYGALHNSFRLMLRELGINRAPGTPLARHGVSRGSELTEQGTGHA